MSGVMQGNGSVPGGTVAEFIASLSAVAFQLSHLQCTLLATITNLSSLRITRSSTSVNQVHHSASGVARLRRLVRPLLAVERRWTVVESTGPAAARLTQLDECGTYGACGEDEVENGIEGAVTDHRQLAGCQDAGQRVPIVGVNADEAHDEERRETRKEPDRDGD